MKRRLITTTVTSMLLAGLLALLPLQAFADQTGDPAAEPIALAPVLITEIQTAMPGSGNASKEFIELYNTTAQPIDLSNWQLWYSSAAADSFDAPTKRIVFAPGNGQPLVISPHGYFVLSGNQAHLADSRDMLYEATLAANGHLRLVRQAEDYAQTCQLEAEDGVSWGTAVPPAGAASSAPEPGESLVRLAGADNTYIDTHSGADFAVTATPTPGVQNAGASAGQSLPHEAILLADPGCTIPEVLPEPPAELPGDSPPSVIETPEEPDEPQAPAGTGPSIPPRNRGLKPPQLSELLPNPASPQTDASDEFIELYNSNEVAFDLSGYVLEMGATTKRRYTIPKGTMLPPGAFLAFFSGDTSISLSNTQGQVRLLDPLGSVLAESQKYESAKDGQAWLLANGTWQWTSKPTPNGLNVVTTPAAGKKAVAKAKQTAASVKSSSTTSGNTIKNEAGQKTAETIAATTSRAPMHGGVLALVGGFALLYGAYEYRRDVANKIHQFRSNRAARRELRQSAKGR